MTDETARTIKLKGPNGLVHEFDLPLPDYARRLLKSGKLRKLDDPAPEAQKRGTRRESKNT